jgi:hypothetical protein
LEFEEVEEIEESKDEEEQAAEVFMGYMDDESLAPGTT